MFSLSKFYSAVEVQTAVVVVAGPVALQDFNLHSTEHGSVEGKLIARASHDHPKHEDDNAQVCHFLEEATRSTSYAATIKPFQRRKNG